MLGLDSDAGGMGKNDGGCGSVSRLLANLHGKRNLTTPATKRADHDLLAVHRLGDLCRDLIHGCTNLGRLEDPTESGKVEFDAHGRSPTYFTETST